MIRLLNCTALLAVLAAPAAAGPRYDVRLEKAAMQIVAQKIGDIRGGFSNGETPVFVRTVSVSVSPTDPIETGAVPKVYSDRRVMTPDDIAVLRQRKVSRVITF
jgi:hypothetical protein